MCIVSNMGDYWKAQLPEKHSWVLPYIPTNPGSMPDIGIPLKPDPSKGPTQAEFDALKKEVEELRKLLLAAKEFDEKTGQPNCEMDEKVELIKKVAELVGVDFTKIFK